MIKETLLDDFGVELELVKCAKNSITIYLVHEGASISISLNNNDIEWLIDKLKKINR